MFYNDLLLIFLYSGFSTEGEILAVLLVGPIAPATNLGFSGFFKVYSSAAFLAISALALFILYAYIFYKLWIFLKKFTKFSIL